jgi:hypothetical protein
MCSETYYTRIQLRIHSDFPEPVLMYGSETWVLIGHDRKQKQTSKMRFLRLTLGVTLGGGIQKITQNKKQTLPKKLEKKDDP